MSEKIITSSNSEEIPKTKFALEEKYSATQENASRVDETNIGKVAEELPQPCGWRLLVLPFTPKEKTKGGIIFSQESLDKARIATNCGYVVKMGPMAYGDKEKFPTGAWCKEGEFVIYGRYSGSRFQTKYGEHRILNDDEIIGKIKDPENILHLF